MQQLIDKDELTADQLDEITMWLKSVYGVEKAETPTAATCGPFINEAPAV